MRRSFRGLIGMVRKDIELGWHRLLVTGEETTARSVSGTKEQRVVVARADSNFGNPHLEFEEKGKKISLYF